MFSSTVYTIFSLLYLLVGFVQSQYKPNCKSDNYTDVVAAVNGLDNCTYPRDKINPECVEIGIRQFTNQSLCPFFTNGTINEKNIETTVDIVNQLLKQKTLCDIPLNPIPFSGLTFNAAQFLKSTPFTGYCTIVKTAYVNNVNNTVISVVHFQSPLTVQMNVSQLTYNGVLNCSFGGQVFNQNFEIPLSNISFDEPINISIASEVPLDNNQTTPNITSTWVTANPKFSAFHVDEILRMFNLNEVFSNAVTKLIENSPLSESYGKFVLAILYNALQATKKQCD
ncbi:hypothetical protein CHUAL_006495 [Chamberlinius hualienensis]